MENQRIGPELRVQDFDDFMPLINGEYHEHVTNFLLNPQRSLEELEEEILKISKIIDSIPFATAHSVRMEMYDMHRTDLINTLEVQAISFKDMLIGRCSTDYQFMSKSYCQLIAFYFY